jgi:hypothetical protein
MWLRVSIPVNFLDFVVDFVFIFMFSYLLAYLLVSSLHALRRVTSAVHSKKRAEQQKVNDPEPSHQ